MLSIRIFKKSIFITLINKVFQKFKTFDFMFIIYKCIIIKKKFGLFFNLFNNCIEWKLINFK